MAGALRGYLLAQIALGLLGGLVITSEYGARTIVSTLTAVPHRARVLAPWSGLAVMAGCVAALLTAAFIVFRRRDA
nr:hypothetical protein [Streptomyces sabulosicollis]